MTFSLRTKVTFFITVVVLVIGAISTTLFFIAQKRSLEREVVARGIALSEALAQSVNEGLAAEDLNLIKQVQNIVHTNDIVLTQVFSPVWLGIAAVPVGQLNVPPDPAAVAYFKTHQDERDHFTIDDGTWINVYKPVFLDPHDPRIARNIFIGYVRLRISTHPVIAAARKAVFYNILVAAVLTLAAVMLLHLILGKYVISPLLGLHRAVLQHKLGKDPDRVPVFAADEIGQLSREFNLMSTAVREREDRLAEEKERLAVTLRSIGDAVIVTDVEGRITLLNKVAEQHTGWTASEAVNKPLTEVFHIVNEKTGERCVNPAEKVIESGVICGLANHTALIKKDGTEIIIEDSAAPIRDPESRIIGIVLVFRDATEKREREEERIKVEKLQSLGVLAGGLAHDFNNLLTAVLGNISIAKMYVGAHGKAYERLVEAEAASRRATELTYQLLTFSKGGAPVKSTTSIVDILREAASLCLHGTSVSARFNVAENIRPVNVDSGQMSQVFNNLIINSTHAMPNGGTITVTVENVVLQERIIAALPAGAYVKVSIRDEGTGIPDEHLPKIFDPYFTTKQQGSGLGLASVYSIIKKHDGHITVASKPGQGATFHVYLPASQNVTTAQPAAPACPVVAGQGRILIMDDEQLVREVSGEMLKELGYEVAFAQHGAQAIEMYQQAREAKTPFHAVIMDLTIQGGMGGKDAITHLLALDPDVKVIVASGYSNDPVMANYKKFGFKAVITKPYTIDVFSKTLREVLQ
jgi:PAS domain S-box-containing protein